jgi:hypothetical protein
MELDLLDAALSFCGGPLVRKFFGAGADARICGVDVFEKYFLGLVIFGGDSAFARVN